MRTLAYSRPIRAMALMTLTAMLWAVLPFGQLAVSGQTDETKTISFGKLKRSDKISSQLYSALESKNANAAEDGNGVAAANSGGRDYVFASIEFTNPAARRALFSDGKVSKLSGAAVLTVVDRFADIFADGKIPLERLMRNPAVRRVEGVRRVSAPPPPAGTKSLTPSKAVPDEIVRDGFGNLKGKGVVIAIVDTGVDFRHPDFITYDSAGQPTSRILHMWDTSMAYQQGRGSPAPAAFPNKAPIGTLFTRQQLTNELRSTVKKIPATDLGGHGTACASVAAGNGNADFRGAAGLKRKEVIGVAPEADIIAVRMGEQGFENGYLLNTIAEWLDKAAGAKPLVVSGSFGGHWYGHDGQTVEERQLDARFPLTKAGRAIVFAAGNEGSDPIHAEVKVSNRESAKWVRWTSRRDGTVMNVFLDSADITDLMMELPDGTTVKPANGAWDYNPITRQASIELTLGAGAGMAKFYTASGKPMKLNIYLPWKSRGDYVATFDRSSATFTGVVGSPGTMTNAITVGSYDWNNNYHEGGRLVILSSVCRGNDGKVLPVEIQKISCYSSPGPTRDNRVKPEIAAPGQWYTSSVSFANGSPVWDADSSGMYTSMNGTSAATPYTAGIIALMFEKKPVLTFGQVRDLIRTNASQDGFTGIPPTSDWGGGKLDLAAVTRIFSKL